MPGEENNEAAGAPPKNRRRERRLKASYSQAVLSRFRSSTGSAARSAEKLGELCVRRDRAQQRGCAFEFCGEAVSLTRPTWKYITAISQCFVFQSFLPDASLRHFPVEQPSRQRVPASSNEGDTFQ